MKRYLIIAGSILAFFVVLIIAVKLTTPSEDELNNVAYRKVNTDNYSGVEKRGYTYENNKLTIYMGGVDGTGEIEINSITNDSGKFIVKITTSTKKSESKIHQTPSVTLKVDGKPNSILVKNQANEVFNLIDPNSDNEISIKCDAGKYYDEQTESCVYCPINTYSGYGDNKCTACPDITCSQVGSKSVSSCGSC